MDESEQAVVDWYVMAARRYWCGYFKHHVSPCRVNTFELSKPCTELAELSDGNILAEVLHQMYGVLCNFNCIDTQSHVDLQLTRVFRARHSKQGRHRELGTCSWKHQEAIEIYRRLLYNCS
jgi:hypothetical protein